MMYEDSAYMVGVIREAVRLHDANTAEEANHAFETLMSDATKLARDTYERIHRTQIGELKTQLHDSRVQAAGGM